MSAPVPVRSFEIAGRAVGHDAPVYFIAELSANHGHSLDRALQTVEAAARAGADAIKLQTYTPDTLTLKSSAPPFVVKTKNEWAGRTLYDLYAEAMTPWEWHSKIIEAARSLGLACFSTPFDATAVAFLEDLDVPAYKIASFELTDLPLVERVARVGRPMILSTGMASLGEIESAVRTCLEAGNDRLALLRCVSAYPAQPEAMNLRSFETLRGFGTILGLSDHTRDATVAVTSVALGARIIEKHFIVDRAIGGPDAFFSLEPDEFASMVALVRSSEKALGPPRFGPSPDEIASTAFRRSLFVARDLKAGEILSCDDVRSVRPAHGMPARELPNVLGRPATRDLRAGTPLTHDMVGPTQSPSVVLRRATSDDAERLLEWRNDATTRAMSLTPGTVSRDEHAAWFARTLAAQDRALFIAERDDGPVGMLRLDAGSHGEWEVSIAVAPTARGRGLAVELLRAADDAARERHAVRLIARIKTENALSIRAFKRAGYYGFAETRHASGRILTCERRLAPFS